MQTFEAPVPIESHIQNFLDCVKSRKEPNAPVEVGASAVSAPHLANVAFHHDRRMYLSADAVEGDGAAGRLSRTVQSTDGAIRRITSFTLRP